MINFRYVIVYNSQLGEVYIIMKSFQCFVLKNE